MTYSIDRNRWSKMSLFQQMGNVSSEVGRSFKAKRLGNRDDILQASKRVLDLIDATVEAQQKSHPARVKEILKSREQFLEVLQTKPAESPESKSLEKYFMQFAIAERLHTI